MEREKLYSLIEKYREGTCTAEEQEALDRWYGQCGMDSEFASVPQEKLDTLFYSIERKVKHRTQKKSRMLRFRYAAAAAILVVLSGSAIYFLNKYDSRPSRHAGTISPGTWQAELIISDGSRVALGETALIEDTGGVVAINESGTGLDYSVNNAVTEQAYHTVVVPLGSEYAITLSDGSRIRLNSGSSLKYPVAFGKDKREVTLTGEAYFSVSKAGNPFIVNTSEFTVEVLGTSFNISAYEDDDLQTAVLVSGSISVKAGKQAGVRKIMPGNLLSYSKATGDISEATCDTDLYTSWVDGEFKFRDMRLEDIMKRLGRWYDCRITFADIHLKDLRYSGAAEKNKPIEYVLEMIEYITNIGYEIDDRNITIKSK